MTSSRSLGGAVDGASGYNFSATARLDFDRRSGRPMALRLHHGVIAEPWTGHHLGGGLSLAPLWKEDTVSKEPKMRRLRRPTHMGATPDAAIRCPLCGDYLHADIADLHAMAEDWVIRKIRRDHPEWIEANGACPKCLEFYRNL